jgi:hypothetical protein
MLFVYRFSERLPRREMSRANRISRRANIRASRIPQIEQIEFLFRLRRNPRITPRQNRRLRQLPLEPMRKSIPHERFDDTGLKRQRRIHHSKSRLAIAKPRRSRM